MTFNSQFQYFPVLTSTHKGLNMYLSSGSIYWVLTVPNPVLQTFIHCNTFIYKLSPRLWLLSPPQFKDKKKKAQRNAGTSTKQVRVGLKPRSAGLQKPKTKTNNFVAIVEVYLWVSLYLFLNILLVISFQRSDPPCL